MLWAVTADFAEENTYGGGTLEYDQRKTMAAQAKGTCTPAPNPSQVVAPAPTPIPRKSLILTPQADEPVLASPLPPEPEKTLDK